MNNNYNIYCDGGSRGNPGPAASAFVLMKGEEIIHKGSKFLGVETNNVAEYGAVLLALKYLEENEDSFSGKNIVFVLDSELVVRQINGLYKVKNEKLKKYFLEIKSNLVKLNLNIKFTNVAREKNVIADSLVNEELDNSIL